MKNETDRLTDWGKFFSLPSLGGLLAMLNQVHWVAIIFCSQLELIPEPLLVASSVIVALPLAIGGVGFWSPMVPFDAPGLVIFAVMVVINSFVWGHGVAWISRRINRIGDDRPMAS